MLAFTLQQRKWILFKVTTAIKWTRTFGRGNCRIETLSLADTFDSAVQSSNNQQFAFLIKLRIKRTAVFLPLICFFLFLFQLSLYSLVLASFLLYFSLVLEDYFHSHFCLLLHYILEFTLWSLNWLFTFFIINSTEYFSRCFVHYCT